MHLIFEPVITSITHFIVCFLNVVENEPILSLFFTLSVQILIVVSRFPSPLGLACLSVFPSPFLSFLLCWYVCVSHSETVNALMEQSRTF